MSIIGDPNIIEFSSLTRITYLNLSKHTFYPFPQAPAIFTRLSGLIISCRLRVTDSRQYRRNLRVVTRQNYARRRRWCRRQGRRESTTTWQRNIREQSLRCRATNFWISDIISSGLTRDPFTVRPIDVALIRPRDYTSRYSNFVVSLEREVQIEII